MNAPTGLRFTVTGVEKAKRKFANIPPATEKAIHAAYSTFGKSTVMDNIRGIENYPAAPSGSTYNRTGRLGAGYSARMYGKYHITISNAVPYAIYVVGDNQARVHQGRWWTLSERINEALPSLLDDLYRLIPSAVDGA